MIYLFLKFIVRLAFKFVYRKIYFTGIHKIPKNRAVIFVSNHPSGFIEPCLLACFLPMPLYFLARGDLFSISHLRWLLIATHQIPIYRFKDGFQGLRSNKDSIQASIKILSDKKHLVIFPEGGTQLVRRLRPLQKGVARIVFAALENNPDQEVIIQPIGFNLSHLKRFRSKVAVEIGDPIETAHYLDLYRRNPVEAVKSMTLEMRSAMCSLIPHIDDKEEQALLDQMIRIHWDLHRPQKKLPIFIKEETWPFQLLQKIAGKLKEISPESKNKLTKDTDDLLKKMESKSFDSGHLLSSRSSIGLQILFLIIGWIPFTIGILINALPFYAGKRLVDAYVKQDEFYISVAMSAMIAFYLIYFCILLVIGIVIHPVAFIILMGAPFFGYFSVISTLR